MKEPPQITGTGKGWTFLRQLRDFVLANRLINGADYAVEQHGTRGISLKFKKGTGGGGDGGMVKRYRFKARGQDPRSGVPYATQHKADWIVCREWDGTTEGGEDVKIALPYQLRRSPWDGMTIAIAKEFPTASVDVTYTYQSNSYRKAVNGTLTEYQEIVPRYRLNDEIYAMESENGTGVSYPTVDPDNPADFLRDELGAIILTDVDLQDLNADGRAWARI